MHHILVVEKDQCREDPTCKVDNLVKSYSISRRIVLYLSNLLVSDWPIRKMLFETYIYVLQTLSAL